MSILTSLPAARAEPTVAGRPALARAAARVARAGAGWVFVEFGDAGPPPLTGRVLPFGHTAFLDADAMDAWLVHPGFHVLK